MLTLLMIGLQSMAGPPASKPDRLRATSRCPAEAAQEGDVVVCGRVDQDGFRLKPLPDRYEEPAAIPRAEVSTPVGAVSANTEQTNVGGFPSNRIMLRVKMPF